MIILNSQQGIGQKIDHEIDAHTVILDSYVGRIIVSGTCKSLHIILYNDCVITNDIKLSNNNKVDTLVIEGKGTGSFKALEASLIEIRSDITAEHIAGSVIKIHDCKVTGDLELPEPPTPADKTALRAAIDNFQNILEHYSISVDGSDIDQDVQWITQENADKFIEALAYGEGIYSSVAATQEQVDEATQKLYQAVADLNPQYGKKVYTDKTILHDLIAQIQILLSQYNISNDGYDIPKDAQWVLPLMESQLQAHLENAKKVEADSTVSQEVVDTSVNKLKYAISNYIPQSGKQVDFELASKKLKAKLLAKIEEATKISNQYSVSDDGNEIPITELWITTFSYNCLITTRNTGENIYNDAEASKLATENMIDSIDIAIQSLNPQNGSYSLSSNLQTEPNISTVSALDMEDNNSPADNALFADNNLNAISNESINAQNAYDFMGYVENSIWQYAPGSLDDCVHLLEYANAQIDDGAIILSELEDEFDAFIDCTGYTLLVDCIFESLKHSVAIRTPYLLADNITSNIVASKKSVATKNPLLIRHCLDVVYDDTHLSCNGLVLDEDNKPKEFVYALIRDESGKVVDIAHRQKLYGYATSGLSEVDDKNNSQPVSTWRNIPAQLANDYDRYKHATQFTNVDLHRWIDQNGEILKGIGTNYITDDTIQLIAKSLWTGSDEEWERIPDETIKEICANIYVYDEHPHTSDPLDSEVISAICDETYVWPKTNGYEYDELRSRKYELKISSLNSYRTTELAFYAEESPEFDELEIP